MIRNSQLALIVLASMNCAPANGAQIFFSTVGPPILSDPLDPDSPTIAPSPLEIGDVPDIQMNVGETRSLHLWLSPDEPPPSQSFYTVALDVAASNAALVRATEFTFANPQNRLLEEVRWDGVVPGQINAPSGFLLQDAYAFSVTAPGIGKRTGSDQIFRSDMGRDANTGAFYLGQLNVQSQTIGRTGLYFRNGWFKTLINLFEPQAVGAPLQYGDDSGPVHDGRVVGVGDPFTPDLALADAVITVCSGGPPDFPASIAARSHNGTDQSSGDARLVSPAAGEFRSINQLVAGRINVVDYPGDGTGDLTLYFDLVDDSLAPWLVSSLNEWQSSDYEARLANFPGVNHDTNAPQTADIAVTFFDRGAAGSSHYIDFNFLIEPGCGLPSLFPIRAVGIGVPEPKTSSMLICSACILGISRAARPRGREYFSPNQIQPPNKR